jgi:ABC-2 type transport system ATP-binding protein
MSVILARGLRKSFGDRTVLDGIDLDVAEGRIVGIIGPNGAGKSTTLSAMAGLTPFEGHLEVLGADPWSNRDRLMRSVCFVADVAILPRWMRARQLLDYVAGVHPGFDRAKADRLLADTGITPRSRVKEMSKGMITQLHLAIALAIDARVLLLDEPTLGLDPLFRKKFFDSLLNDYVDGNRTVVIATHQLEEIQNVLTDVVFMNRGRVVLFAAVDDIESRFVEVTAHPDRLGAARALGPIHEREAIGRTILTFDGVPREQLESIGETRIPALADLFIASMESSRRPQ